MTERTGVDIREACLSDFEEWFRLYDAVAAEGMWIAGESPTDRVGRRESFEAHLQDPGAVTLLAESAGRVVGHLGVGVRAGIAELGMLVASEWRGRGVGSALLRACVEWSRRNGAHKVVLQVWPHNQAAQMLYRKFGFEREGLLRRHYRRRNGELWDAVCMGLVLDHQSPGCPY